MVQLKPRFQTFEDYLAYDDNSDRLYELFNGELVEVPPESGFNVEIATLLLIQLAAKVGHRRVRGHGLELEVRGEPKNRYPDLTIIRSEHIEQLKQRNTIRLSMAPPVLVVEVVSPGALQRDRDYIAKRNQYEDIGILEYWIVNPQEQTILVLEWADGGYGEGTTLRGDDRLSSSNLGTLLLTVEQLFSLDSTE
ncbi:Uma2 family endonuclease [Leptolyngbya cf. ectocarpi LEGE 11479]|uniref:Uma2 family endonuclease n=1 Tax=Leptolyngbya cf. ectocarpi LEGE 11479 TaxID=1828722 RepID=A0A928ZYN6_LEPEC|nr:Uma2 family endonuclease [Leptolyngbya ectocarpi]MBE9069853.1 Uma2 family endonuclease [Leptolyngbya cf. ectocarpi LEGE 11479]